MPDLRKIEEALEFYADISNYDDGCAPFVMVTSHECVHEYIEMDMGKVAREALQELQAYRECLDSEELLTPVDVAKELESSFAPDNAADIAQHVYQPLLQAIKTIKESGDE